MGLSFPKGTPSHGGAMFVPSAEFWLTADRSRVVLDGHPEAAFLFCVKGRAIPMADAKKFGLFEEPKAEQEPVPEVKESAPAETKELKPEGTKRRRR